MIRAQTGPDHTLMAEAACHDARTLTEGGNIAYIVLVGQAHTLRINRVGKLILTKRSIPAIIGVTDAALSSGCIFIAPRCVHSTP